MGFFGLIATAAAPLMTSIAFIAMILKNTFDLSTAFTIMFLF